MSLTEFFLKKGWVIVRIDDKEYYLLDLTPLEIVRFAESVLGDNSFSLNQNEKELLGRLIEGEEAV